MRLSERRSRRGAPLPRPWGAALQPVRVLERGLSACAAWKRTCPDTFYLSSCTSLHSFLSLCSLRVIPRSGCSTRDIGSDVPVKYDTRSYDWRLTVSLALIYYSNVNNNITGVRVRALKTQVVCKDILEKVTLSSHGGHVWT